MGEGFAGYFLDVDRLTEGDVIIRHQDPHLGPVWLLFRAPNRILSTSDPTKISSLLEDAERHTKQQGGYSVGYVAYDDGQSPRAWIALYSEPPQRYRELTPVYDPPKVELEPPSWSESEFSRRFQQVKNALQRGDCYQINLTFRQQFHLQDNPARFFASRCGVDPPDYACYIDGGDFAIASFSPELFFERSGSELRSIPMKGTAPLSQPPEGLSQDPKSIAENLMIVDMVRNDLGRISKTGSIDVPRLMSVERQRALWQMVSEVTGRTDAPLSKIFSALFPPASVTGAPKIAVTNIISQLEDSPRGVYCGAIGYMGPGYQRFNVAIRTATIDKKTGQGSFGIGSGIVWDSDCASEYAECLSKRDFLLNPGKPWALVESIAADRKHVSKHIDRLFTKQEDLEIALYLDGIESAIRSCELGDDPKIRLEVRRDGSFTVSSGPSQISKPRLTASLAHTPIASGDPNLQIKTTSRAVYDRHLQAADTDEVLLYNERKQITEFCRGNVILRLGDILYTPWQDVGCLPGVGIATLLEKGEVQIAALTLTDLPKAEAIYFVNAVTGMIPVDLKIL